MCGLFGALETSPSGVTTMSCVASASSLGFLLRDLLVASVRARLPFLGFSRGFFAGLIESCCAGPRAEPGKRTSGGARKGCAAPSNVDLVCSRA